MKKMFFGILAVVLTSGISYASDVQQQDASIGLNVPQIIELVGIDMSESITPGPEDYARDLQVARVVNDAQGKGSWQTILIGATSGNYGIVLHGYTLTSPAPSNITTASEMSIVMGGTVGTVTYKPYPSGAQVTTAHGNWIPQYTTIWVGVGIPGISNNTGGDAAVDNAMYDANNDIGKGFAERTDALAMTIFTNAQDGAALYVHGLQPAQQQGILRLEDTYVAVCTEKTYILQNDLEGAYANACSGAVMETTTMTPSNTQRVEDNPRNNMGGDTEYTATMGTSTAGINVHGGAATDKAYSTWLRLHNQAQHLFEVKMSTKAPRLVVVNLGIANLARYTEGEYTNTLTFTLMPIVG